MGILGERVPGLLTGLNEGARNGCQFVKRRAADLHGSVMAAQGRIAYRKALDRLETGEAIGIAPPGVAQLRLAIIIGRIAARYDEAVDRALTAPDFTTRDIEHPVV